MKKNYRKTTKELLDMWQKQRKPKEYNVLIETELVNQISYNGVTGSNTSIQQPKITNNTIKVLRVIN